MFFGPKIAKLTPFELVFGYVMYIGHSYKQQHKIQKKLFGGAKTEFLANFGLKCGVFWPDSHFVMLITFVLLGIDEW